MRPPRTFGEAVRRLDEAGLARLLALRPDLGVPAPADLAELATRAATDITGLSAAELGEKIASRELSSVEVTQAHLDQIAATDETYHAFLHVGAQEALAAAAAVDKQVAAGEPLASPLAGVPLALKDVFTTTDAPTTAGSKILEGWRSPYDATVTARLS